MDNNFSNILGIFKKLDEQYGPAATAAIQNGEGSTSVAFADLDDKNNEISAMKQKQKLAQQQSQQAQQQSQQQNVQQVNELDKETLKRYAKANVDDQMLRGTAASFTSGAKGDKYNTADETHKDVQRQKGFTRAINKLAKEDTMAGAEQHERGPKFTGYWKGTDKTTPGKHMVGASESVEEQISREWNTYLNEYGMTTGGTAMGGGTAPTAPGVNQNDPKQQAQDLQKTTNALNGLKSAGLNVPNMSQAVKSTLKVNDPKAQPNQQDKNVGMGLGQTLEKVITTAQPNEIGQLKNIIKKMAQGGQQ